MHGLASFHRMIATSRHAARGLEGGAEPVYSRVIYWQRQRVLEYALPLPPKNVPSLHDLVTFGVLTETEFSLASWQCTKRVSTDG